MKLHGLFVALTWVALSWLSPAWADSIIEDVPDDVNTAKRYIVYLHGSTEEDEGSTEKYEAAVEAIAGGKNVVISEVRDDTDPNEYARKIKAQVAKLQQAGVAKRNITVTGFSKGAIIALAAAGEIQDPEMKYVLLAGCSEELNEKYSVDPAAARGRILAIYDADDDKFGSCKGIINPGDGITLKEKKLNSGKGHALFRIPKDKFIDQWRGPLVKWAKKK
jgi:hypothetical protein